MTSAELLKQAEALRAQIKEGEEEHARQRAADPNYKPPYAGTIDSTIYLLNLKASGWRLIPALAARLRDALAVVEAARHVTVLGGEPGDEITERAQTLYAALAVFDAGPAAAEKAKPK